MHAGECFSIERANKITKGFSSPLTGFSKSLIDRLFIQSLAKYFYFLSAHPFSTILQGRLCETIHLVGQVVLQLLSVIMGNLFFYIKHFNTFRSQPGNKHIFLKLVNFI